MEKALLAQKKGAFLSELAVVISKAETVLVDESPDEHKLAKLPRLKPVFQKDGTITAGNASSMPMVLQAYAHVGKHGKKTSTHPFGSKSKALPVMRKHLNGLLQHPLIVSKLYSRISIGKPMKLIYGKSMRHLPSWHWQRLRN